MEALLLLGLALLVALALLFLADSSCCSYFSTDDTRRSLALSWSIVEEIDTTQRFAPDKECSDGIGRSGVDFMKINRDNMVAIWGNGSRC